MLRDENFNQSINSPNISADVRYDYYSYLFVSQNIPSENVNDNTLSFICNNFDGSILNEQISDEEIIKRIKRSKNNKSPGPDGISVEMYKKKKKNFSTYFTVPQ